MIPRWFPSAGNATDGYTVTGLKEGKVTITATQPGQAPWNSGHRYPALHRDLGSPSGSKHHLCGYS